MVLFVVCSIWVDAAKKNNVCKGKANDTILRHPIGCTHYYTCVKGVPKTGICEEGMLYSAVNPPCVPEAESECQDSTRTTTEATSSVTTTTKSTSKGSKTSKKSK